MARPWKYVYVFVSSTFDDMRAERDYLVPLRINSYTSLSRQRFPRISPFKRFGQGFVEVVDEVEQPLA
jgi:hypothetical protein